VERLLDRGLAGAGGYFVVTGVPGSGRTTLADAATDLARTRGMRVFRTAGADASADSPVWNRLLADLELGELPPDAGKADFDRAATAIAAGGNRLLVIDDIDKADKPALTLLALLAPRLAASATVLLVTSAETLGLTTEVCLSGLAEPDLATVLTDLSPDAVHAVWLVTGGLPGPAIVLAGDLVRHDTADDAVTWLAMTAPSRAGFLDLDTGLVRLLETAARRPLLPAHRARVLARLARELLGDSSAGQRRRDLIDEAVTLARMSGSPSTIAEVLDSRLHALWDPAAARERLTTAAEIIEQAHTAGEAGTELRGLFWRFVALAELGDLAAAESALTAYARAGAATGDTEVAVVVLARQAMLATVRGRFDSAAALADEVAVRGRQAGLPDTDRLVGSLRTAIAAMRGGQEALVEPWRAMGRQLPGHFFEATAARILAESGRHDEASLELERLLPAVLAGSGPRWLGAVADLATVASHVGEPAQAQALYDALLPYQGRLVVWGGANTIAGPVDDYLGRLAIQLSRPDLAVSHLDSAVNVAERTGALPWLVNTLVARAGALTMRGEGFQAGEDLRRARSIAGRLGMRGQVTPADEWRLSHEGTGWRLEADVETAL
jgi:hypothetical protein